MTISFLHTSKVHIQCFDQIVKSIDDTIVVRHFVNEAYEEVITQKIQATNFTQGVIYLAQASMEGPKNYLEDNSFEVVSSAKFGLEYFISTFKK